MTPYQALVKAELMCGPTGSVEEHELRQLMRTGDQLPRLGDMPSAYRSVVNPLNYWRYNNEPVCGPY